MGDVIVQSLSMYGLMICVAVLAAVLIRLIVITLEWVHRQQAARKAKAAPAPVAAAAPPPAAAVPDMSADDLAAISAAVYAIVGAHRLVRVELPAYGAGWRAAGRIMHHTSHAITRGPRRPNP